MISIELQIYFDSNKICTISVDPKSKIKNLYKLISIQLKCSNFNLYHYKTNALLQGSYTLEDCDIKQNSILELVYQKETIDKPTSIGFATLEIGQVSFPFIDFAHSKRIEIDINAPRWRKPIRGLNLIGKCLTEKCKAQNQDVYIPIGTECSMPYQLSQAQCPECKNKIDNIVSCIIWDCQYEIAGTLEKNNEKRNILNKAPRDCFHLFTQENNGENHVLDWKTLTITCTTPSFISFKHSLILTSVVALTFFGCYIYRLIKEEKK